MRTTAAWLLATAIAACVPAAAIAQEPCVGYGFDTPLPGAENVLTRYADVPAARFPGRWQEGQIFDYIYRLYPDLTGAVGDPPRMTDWRVIVTCSAESQDCQYEQTEEAPQLAVAIAQALGHCLLGDMVTTGTFEDLLSQPVPEPAPQTASTPTDTPPETTEADAVRPSAIAPSNSDLNQPPPDPDTQALNADERPSRPLVPTEEEAGSAPAAPGTATTDEGNWDPTPSSEPRSMSPLLGPSLQPPRTCGLQAVPDGPPVLTLQRLLWLAGQNPGPPDGIMGRQTRRALVALLGPGAEDLPTDEAIRQVDLELCYE
jgi:hypothetical protein